MASDKREWINRLFGDMGRLQRAGSDYAAMLEQLRKTVKQFIKSENIGIREEASSRCCHPGYDFTSGYAQTNSSIPAVLSAVVSLLDEELTLINRVHTGHEAVIDKYHKQLAMAFDAAKTCDHCGRLSEFSQMRHLSPPQDNILICEECWMNEYFDCRKCGRTLPSSEQGEEDTQLGYGWICKDCQKPIGFPQEVVIAPDFPGCEEVAARSLSELREYASNVSGGMTPDSQDVISLKLLKRLSEYDALYESPKGVKYEIGELDYRGVGSMRELEE